MIERLKQTFSHGGGLSESDFAWFPIRMDLTGQPFAITHESGGKAYVLLWNKPPHVILASQDWGLESVYRVTDANRRPAIGLTFNDKGASLFHDLTAAHVQQNLAIVVEGTVVAMPNISASLGRAAIITGNITEQEIDDLLTALRKDIGRGRAEPNTTRTPRAGGPGPLGRCALSFDGLDDCLLVPASASLAIKPPFTIETWLKPAPDREPWDTMILMRQGRKPDDPKKPQVGGFLIWGGRSQESGVPGTGSLFLGDAEGRFAQEGMMMSPPLEQPGWAYLCARCDGGEYVSAEGEPLWIGAGFVTEDINLKDYLRPLRGQIGEIRIWNRFLTDAEAQRYRPMSLTGDEPGLVACWTFEEGSGQVVHDISPNANHARLGKLNTVDDADPTWVDLSANPL